MIQHLISKSQRLEHRMQEARYDLSSIEAIQFMLTDFGYLVTEQEIIRPGTVVVGQGPVHYIWHHTREQTEDLIRTHLLQDVVLIGTQYGIIDAPIRSSPQTLRRIVYLFPWVTEIRRDWMKDCPSLTTVDFIGLENVTIIGDNWMCRCPQLSSIHNS